MRLISHLLSFFLCLLLAGGLPGHHGHYDGMHRRWKAVQQHARDEATLDPICLPIPTEVHSQNDLLSKIRPADGVCQLDEHVLQPPSSSSVIQLPRRQDDDPYSCNENKPCGNHACCAKSGFCGYGPDYCGTDGQSPNDVCWSNCDAHAEYVVPLHRVHPLVPSMSSNKNTLSGQVRSPCRDSWPRVSAQGLLLAVWLLRDDSRVLRRDRGRGDQLPEQL